MKKTKKILAVTMAAMLMMGALAGCGSKEKTNDTKTDVEDSVSAETEGSAEEESKTYTLSEFFAEKERVWLYMNDESMSGVIDKNMQVSGIFVTNPDGTLIYTYGGSDAGLKTVGDYAQMSDEDIIAFVKENPYETRLDKHKQDSISADAKAELREDAKQLRYKYSFNVTTDSTGNGVESEQLVYQTYPDTVSVTDYQGNSVKPDYVRCESYVSMIHNYMLDLANTYVLTLEQIQEAHKKAIFTFDFGTFSNMITIENVDRPVSSDIYNSHYAGFRTLDADYGMLVTKTDNINVTFDGVGTEGIHIDKNASDIYGEEIVLTKEVDLFYNGESDKRNLNNYLCGAWDMDKLMDAGLLDTVFEYGKVDRQAFKEYMDLRLSNGPDCLKQETYDRLIAEGYMN